MKMIYISLQLSMWVYRETDFMISTIPCNSTIPYFSL